MALAWKASWVHALAGSNPASSAIPIRGNAEADPSGRRSRPAPEGVRLARDLNKSRSCERPAAQTLGDDFDPGLVHGLELAEDLGTG